MVDPIKNNMISHERDIGRCRHCEFGHQPSGVREYCRCENNTLVQSRPGWEFPDCINMLPQYDPAAANMVHHEAHTIIECACCGDTVPKYEVVMTSDGFVCSFCSEEFYSRCRRCGMLSLSDSMDDHYCESCQETALGRCDDCRSYVFDNEEYFSSDCSLYCERCAPDHTTECDWCGEIVLDDEIIHTGHDVALCPYCADHVTECEICGNVVPSDDAITTDDGTVVCNRCYETRMRSIHGYMYQPPLEVYGGLDTIEYYSVELEIDNGNCAGDCATELVDRYQYLWCTQDGSLSDGFEFKTHPMTFEYITRSVDWDGITGVCRHHGFRSHDTNTCGLHVHVDMRVFGRSEEERYLHGMRIAYLMDKFSREFYRLSRRKSHELSWCRWYDLETGDIQEFIHKSADRYRCFTMHTKSRKTSEFRFPKGTLKPTTIVATVQLCKTIIDVTRTRGLQAIEHMTWSDFCRLIPADYKELHEYIQARGVAPAQEEAVATCA